MRIGAGDTHESRRNGKRRKITQDVVSLMGKSFLLLFFKKEVLSFLVCK
jgi:hypothetical protein